jgi:hypothetical protein
MTQIVLVFIGISILFIVFIIDRKEKKIDCDTYQNFDEVLDNKYKKRELFFEEKRTNFLEKISNCNFEEKLAELEELEKLAELTEVEELGETEKIEENKSIKDIVSMLNQGYTEEQICKNFDIGKGELQLIINCYKE